MTGLSSLLVLLTGVASAVAAPPNIRPPGAILSQPLEPTPANTPMNTPPVNTPLFPPGQTPVIPPPIAPPIQTTTPLSGDPPTTTPPVNPGSCFPYGNAVIPDDLSAPKVPLASWWCPQSMAYGFQGFSYPLEVDCGDGSLTVDAMDKDFARMKKDFGASIVRMYYPICTEKSVFVNAIKAAAKNNMGLVVQVWTNFGDGNSVWKASEQAIYDAMEDPSVAAIAPYVVHSAEFGSEPIADSMDGGDSQYAADLGKFRENMKSYGVKVCMSEDWDRPGKLKTSGGGNSLTSLGQQIKQNSDVIHAHVMPFYHGSLTESQTWAYIKPQIEWLTSTLKMPTMITETQWASGETDHYKGHPDTNPTAYANYWRQFDDNCEFFKEQNVGWFLHAWSGEGAFDMVKDDGSYQIPGFRPRKC
ncbi:hypothetical protein BGZ63DRAFT_382094 [Mariannaea sp. PMI_226]|nr:hypothetical protein BGZ63DRAFT_382094 [Mariannaea sp. PMI_226]